MTILVGVRSERTNSSIIGADRRVTTRIPSSDDGGSWITPPQTKIVHGAFSTTGYAAIGVSGSPVVLSALERKVKKGAGAKRDLSMRSGLFQFYLDLWKYMIDEVPSFDAMGHEDHSFRSISASLLVATHLSVHTICADGTIVPAHHADAKISYVAEGSGAPFALGALACHDTDGPDPAVAMVYKGLDIATRFDSGCGPGYDVLEVRKDSVKNVRCDAVKKS